VECRGEKNDISLAMKGCVDCSREKNSHKQVSEKKGEGNSRATCPGLGGKTRRLISSSAQGERKREEVRVRHNSTKGGKGGRTSCEASTSGERVRKAF